MTVDRRHELALVGRRTALGLLRSDEIDRRLGAATRNARSKETP